MHPRLTPYLRQRLALLLAGNVVVLASIFFLLKSGSSFTAVLGRSGSDLAPVILAGIGMTAVIYSGAIDLSIASIMVAAATVFGILVHRNTPAPAAFAACLATTWLLSMLNGWLVRRLRVPAIIITLAGLAAYRGLALILADAAIPNFAGNISVHEEIYHGPGKAYAGWILLAGVAAALVWEAYGRVPRQLLALGNSEEACRLMGLRPDAIVQQAFCVNGLFLAAAALIAATRVQAIEPARMELGFELRVIGAVVLGGTNIFGGEGSFIGTILGAFFLYFMSQILVYAGASPYIQEALIGTLILGVIGFDCALHRNRKRLEEVA